MAIVKVGNEDVNLDDDIFNITPENVNEFLSKHASLYKYFSTKRSDAAFICKKYQNNYNNLLNAKFREYKVAGGSDKLAEASAKSDEEVIKLQEKVMIAEYVKDAIDGHLKALSFAQENAKELCFNIRKEMGSIAGSRVMKLSEMDEKLHKIFDKGE